MLCCKDLTTLGIIIVLHHRHYSSHIKMRPQFHLFVVKSAMALALENKEGRIFTLTDIVKFYDKEMLNDAILATHGTVNRKALRLWWKMNQSTLISVKTGPDWDWPRALVPCGGLRRGRQRGRRAG